jgi:hypothetical protein
MAGLSSFPGNLDSFATPGPNNRLSDPGFEHDVVHNKVHDALRAIESTLGVNPQGSGATTVAARLQSISDSLGSLQSNLAVLQSSGGLGLYVTPPA